jgi:antitoxin HicB
MKRLTYEIVIEREEDPKAGFSVHCPDLPGCVSNGGTAAEAKRNIREAMELYLENLIAHGEEIPRPRKAVQVGRVACWRLHEPVPDYPGGGIGQVSQSAWFHA